MVNSYKRYMKLYIFLFIIFSFIYVYINRSSYRSKISPLRQKYALCISGSIRSLPRSLFLESVLKLIKILPSCDVFFVLKTEDKKNSKTLMNNSLAIDSLIHTFKVLNVKFVYIFDRFEDNSIDESRYNSQLLCINKSFNLASSHSNYDWYIRYRPDFILHDPHIDISRINENYIYTTRKYDAVASDQVILFSDKMKKKWWNKLPLIIQKKKAPSPEYEIFNHINRNILKNGPCFYGGLLRNDSSTIKWWDKPQGMIYKDRIKLSETNQSFMNKKYKIELYEKLEKNKINFKYDSQVNHLEFM